jgi:hypothetical protein
MALDEHVCAARIPLEYLLGVMLLQSLPAPAQERSGLRVELRHNFLHVEEAALKNWVSETRTRANFWYSMALFLCVTADSG